MTMVPSPLAARVKAAAPGAVNLTVPGLARDLWDYQVNDVAWLIAQRDGLVGHEVGTGKTVFGIAVAQWLKSRGELRGMVVLCPKQSGMLPTQWAEELAIWAPELRVTVAADLSKRERQAAYRENWDVLVVNYEAARNDVAALRMMVTARRPSILYCDEASVFRKPTTLVGRLVTTIAPAFSMKFAVTGTPIETGLEDLWGIFYCMGWSEILGLTEMEFMRRFTTREQVEFYARGGRKMRKTVVTGYRNLAELRALIEPWFIRRTEKDPEVSRHLPSVQPFVLRVPMTQAQARGYQALKDGIVAKISNGQIQVTPTGIQAPWYQMLGCADGLQTLDPDMKDESGKSDWLMAVLQAQLRADKVLVFSRYVRSIWPLQLRLEDAGIGYGRFLGRRWQTDAERREDVRRFKEDPDCRVLLATTAVERGLNLQVARAVVFYGILTNPARLEQIMGRIRRGGSPHATVYAITLLSAGTVEEALWDEKVVPRNAVKDSFWEEESVLIERLGPEELARLITS